MNPFLRISLATTAAGIIVLLIGILPLYVVSEFIPAGDTTFYGFMFLLLTPVGAVILIIGIVMVLAAWVRSRL